MNTPHLPTENHPVRIESPSGLRVQVNANGSIRRMDYRDIILNLFLGTEMEGGPANIYLRRGKDTSAKILPLLGPYSPAAVQVEESGMSSEGEWGNVSFRFRFVLAKAAPAWFWHVELENTGGHPETLDLIHTQDLALAHYWAVRINEYYISHYVDHTPLLMGNGDMSWLRARTSPWADAFPGP